MMFYLTPMGIVVLTWSGWAWIALFLFAYAVLIMLGFAMILRALDNTQKAKARRARELPAEARAKIGELALQVVEGAARERTLRSQNGRMRGQLAEESSHGRNWRADTQELLKEEVPV
jgi:ABC-type multidrug transport system fused ATPase/permease subunit